MSGPRPAGALAAAVLVTGAALAAVVVDWPVLRGPAPYPPEWQWELRAVPAPGPWAPALACAAVLVALQAAAARVRSTRAAVGLLAAGTVAGFALATALVAVEPGGALQTLARRALSRTITSYLTVAATEEARDPLAFLRQHADALPRYHKQAKHAATHPPGAVLFYRGLIAVADAAPAAARLTLRVGEMREEPVRADAPGRSARAAAVWGPLLIFAGAVLAAWPVAGLARALGLSPAASTQAGLLWLLLPGPLLHSPQFDQALALPVACAALAVAAAARAASGASAGAFAALAGTSAAAAIFVSYGSAVPLAVSCGAAAWALAGDRWRALRLALGAALVAVLLFAATALLGHAPLRAAVVGLTIHREAYTAPRSYGLWLLWNPVDLFVFLGPPIATLAACSLLARWRAAPSPCPPAVARFARATGVGLGLVLVSGTLRGEAGRVLVPLMPVLLLAATGPLVARDRPLLAPRDAALLAVLLATWTLTLRALWEVY